MRLRLDCSWCKDHIPPRGYGDGAPYLRIKNTTIDGLGVEHAFLYGECQRCGKEYNIANLHLPKK